MPPSEFINYPPAVAAADTSFVLPADSNPVVSGLTLNVLSHIVDSVPPLQKLLWKNAGFGKLRELEDSGALTGHGACFNPAVIRRNISAASEAAAPSASAPTTPKPEVFYSAADYIEAYKSGATTPTAVAETVFEFVDTLPALHRTFISVVSKEELLAAAAASTARYASNTALPLDGVPLAVKDEFDVAGTPRTLGLSTAEATARGTTNNGTTLCVQRLLDAGMLFIGKTNMHELGLDTTGNNVNHGIPMNPYNPVYYPGGSSSGSGVAVGTGLVPIAVGADGGGSIRVPSTYCGVFGHKPSHDLVPITPTASLAPSVGVAGPMCAHLSDVRAALEIMAAQPFPSSPSSSKKLGIFEPWFDAASPEVQRHTRKALDFYVSRGWELIPVTLPQLALARTAHALTILTEISGGQKQNTTGLSGANRLLFAVGRQTPARDFVLAQKLRTLLMSHLADIWKRHPGLVIVSPVTPFVGVKKEPGAEAGVSDSDRSLQSMLYVFLANFVGAPCAAGTVGYDEESGMPVGLMGMAEWGEDAMCLDWLGVWEGSWEGRKRGRGWVDVLGAAKKRSQSQGQGQRE